MILLILAATTFPLEFQSPSATLIDVKVEITDIISNIMGYVPVGIVLADIGVLSTLLIGTLLSAIAEISQVFIPDRFPSPVDIVSNVVGTGIGIIFAIRWHIRDMAIPIGPLTTGLALVSMLILLSAGVIAGRREVMELPSNHRGATSLGTLEGHWAFDQVADAMTPDSSGNHLDGKLVNGAHLTEGHWGSNAVQLPSPKAFVDLGNPVALRLAGSMTISVWINSSSFPVDDAVIISSLSERQGYQLDTTVDQGARTIGFKVTDLCGNLMIRYGATELRVNTWYHVAGIYSAVTRTLDVYLNGHLDNGTLLGRVTAGQQPSGQPVYIGRRPDSNRYPFIGSIDDFRIYSLPLDQSEIKIAMHGGSISEFSMRSAGQNRGRENGENSLAQSADINPCIPSLSDRDAMLPLFAVSLGMLAAITVTGFWIKPIRIRVLICLVGGLLAGPLIVATGVSALPWYELWMLPLYGVAGAISVVASTYVLPPLRFSKDSS